MWHTFARFDFTDPVSSSLCLFLPRASASAPTADGGSATFRGVFGNFGVGFLTTSWTCFTFCMQISLQNVTVAVKLTVGIAAVWPGFWICTKKLDVRAWGTVFGGVALGSILVLFLVSFSKSCPLFLLNPCRGLGLTGSVVPSSAALGASLLLC